MLPCTVMSTHGHEDFKIVHSSSPGEDELVYHPGSEVTGNLFSRVTSPQQFDNIVINLRSEGKVRWTKTTVHVHTISSNSISNFHSTTAVRSAEKVYVDLTKSLWSKSGTPDRDSSLPPGDHSFPFHFVLPPGVPSSHESTTEIPGPLDKGDKDSGWTRFMGCRLSQNYLEVDV